MDQIEALIRQAAKNEDVMEMKKTMFKPLQEKQDQIDDRLKRLERGGLVTAGGGGGGEGVGQGGGRGGNFELKLQVLGVLPNIPKHEFVSSKFPKFLKNGPIFSEKSLKMGTYQMAFKNGYGF